MGFEERSTNAQTSEASAAAAMTVRIIGSCRRPNLRVATKMPVSSSGQTK